MLDALARALRLSAVQQADPGLLRTMVALDHVPVLPRGLHGVVLARNGLLTAILG